MRTIEKERLKVYAANPDAASRAATGMPAAVFKRHLQIVARLIRGDKLGQSDVTWLSELARTTNVPPQYVTQAVQRINAERDPDRRAAMYAAGIGGDERAGQIGMQMARSYGMNEDSQEISRKIDSNRPAEIEKKSELDPYWAKRYKDEQKDEQSRRNAIHDALYKQTGYLAPERMTFQERRENASLKATALADTLSASADRPRSLREEVSASVHTDAVLTECADLGLNDGSDSLASLNERDNADELNARFRAAE